MNLFEKILTILDAQMITPIPYGWFHLLFIVITITATFLIIKISKNFNDKQHQKTLFIISCILLLLETYKQLNFSYDSFNDTWKYKWYAFPFQFCSVPMYIMLIASFLKSGKLRDTLFSFLSTFSLLAGLIVMLIPHSVLSSTIGISIQTMIHHGSMILVGIYLIANNRFPINRKNIISATYVFIFMVTIAFSLNLIIYNSNILNGETFDMFFISPYFSDDLPILKPLKSDIPYPIFLLIYLISFTLGAYLILNLELLIKNKIKK